jgi:hypothetical protein
VEFESNFIVTHKENGVHTLHIALWYLRKLLEGCTRLCDRAKSGNRPLSTRGWVRLVSRLFATCAETPTLE